jgi:hypothetical protein
MFNFSTLSILVEVRLTFKFIKGHRNLFGQQIPHGSPYFWQYKSIQVSSKFWNVEIHQVYYSGVGTLKLTSPFFVYGEVREVHSCGPALNLKALVVFGTSTLL